MIASLPMYDWPEVRVATDGWWQVLARAFREAGIKNIPRGLSRSDTDNDCWHRPDLLLSQTCGYPYTHGGAQTSRLVATPVYDADGCSGPDYCSFLLCHRESPQKALDDFRGTRAVINDRQSQSGYSALRAMVAPLARQRSFFRDVHVSGGHRQSMLWVGQGKADLCAVDAVCYALARRYVPALTECLRIVARSAAAPGLPLITSVTASDDLVRRLRDGLSHALSEPSASDLRAALLISGADLLAEPDYQRILEIEKEAVVQGYPELI